MVGPELGWRVKAGDLVDPAGELYTIIAFQ